MQVTYVLHLERRQLNVGNYNATQGLHCHEKGINQKEQKAYSKTIYQREKKEETESAMNVHKSTVGMFPIIIILPECMISPWGLEPTVADPLETSR